MTWLLYWVQHSYAGQYLWKMLNTKIPLLKSLCIMEALKAHSAFTQCLQWIIMTGVIMQRQLPRDCNTAVMTAAPPWMWNSKQSSPVKLWGPDRNTGQSTVSLSQIHSQFGNLSNKHKQDFLGFIKPVSNIDLHCKLQSFKSFVTLQKDLTV